MNAGRLILRSEGRLSLYFTFFVRPRAIKSRGQIGVITSIKRLLSFHTSHALSQRFISQRGTHFALHRVSMTTRLFLFICYFVATKLWLTNKTGIESIEELLLHFFFSTTT